MVVQPGGGQEEGQEEGQQQQQQQQPQEGTGHEGGQGPGGVTAGSVGQQGVASLELEQVIKICVQVLVTLRHCTAEGVTPPVAQVRGLGHDVLIISTTLLSNIVGLSF